MENEIQPSVPSGQPLPQAPISVPPHTNWSKILLFILLGIIVIAGSIFTGIQIGKNMTQDKTLSSVLPTPTIFNQTISPSPTQFQSDTSGIDYKVQIIDALKAGQIIKKINNPSLKLPPDINQAQILNYFQLGDIYFALVMQHSMNVVLNTPKDFSTTFAGILISKQGKSQWVSFTEIKDKGSNNKNNPYYLWTDSNKLLLSVVDQNGAGSGEGIMKLFTFSNGGNWELIGCYYFGGSYNQPSDNGDYFAYSSKLSKQTQKPLTECNNVMLTSDAPSSQ